MRSVSHVNPRATAFCLEQAPVLRKLLGFGLGMAVAAACAMIPVTALAQAAQAEQARQSKDDQPPAAGQLAAKSDAELTALTARWAELNPAQRRELLAEVRGRMARNGAARGVSKRPVKVVVQRRYGRVVRKSDGRVVVQTRVVEMTPRGNASRSRVTFGIGFERRAQEHAGVPASAAETSPSVPVHQSVPEQSGADSRSNDPQ